MYQLQHSVNGTLPGGNEMDKLASTIVKGTEELQEKRERTLSDTRDNDMEQSSSLVIPRIRKKINNFSN